MTRQLDEEQKDSGYWMGPIHQRAWRYEENLLLYFGKKFLRKKPADQGYLKIVVQIDKDI